MEASTTPLLQAFYELAAAEADKRKSAVISMIRHLKEAQNIFEEQSQKLGALPPAASARPCCNDLKYAVSRLVKGLSSSRSAARQGFSLALAEVLQSFANVSTAEIVASVLKETASQSQASKSEQRDALLGRVFGIVAIQRSGRLSSVDASDAALVVAQLAKELFAAAAKKSWLSAAAHEGISAIVSSSSKQVWSKQLAEPVLAQIPVDVSKWNADHVALVLSMEVAAAKWAASSNKDKEGAPLPGPVLQLQSALASSAAGADHPLNAAALDSTKTYPALHPMWLLLLERYSGSVLRVKDAEGAPTRDVVAATSEFSGWWTAIVSNALLRNGQERKAAAVALLTTVAPAAGHSASAIDVILTPGLLKFLITQLNSSKQVLHGASKAAMAAVVEACRSGSTDAAAGALAAITTRGGPNFDKLTHTQTCATLMSMLSEEALLVHVRIMVKAIVDPSTATLAGDDEDDAMTAEGRDVDFSATAMANKRKRGGDEESDDEETIDDNKLSPADKARLDVAQSLSHAVRNTSLAALRKPENLMPIVNLLAFHAFASVSSASSATSLAGLATKLQLDRLSAPGSSAAALLVATPALSDAARAEMRSKLLTLTRDLVSMQNPTAAAQQQAGGKATAVAEKRDRATAASALSFTLLSSINAAYDAAVDASKAASGAITLHPSVADLSGDDDRGMDDSDDDDDEDDEDSEGGDAAAGGKPASSPIESRARALRAASALHKIASALSSADASGAGDAAKQASSYAILLAQTALTMISDPSTAGDAAGAAMDLVACSSRLLSSAFDAAREVAGALPAADDGSLSKKASKEERRKSKDGKKASVLADALAALQAVSAEASALSGDADSDDDEEGSAASSSAGSNDKAMLVFVDALLALLSNAGAPLRDAAKACARQVFGSVTVTALQPILDLLSQSFSSGGTAGDEDEDGDDGDDDDEGSENLAGGDDDDDEASVTLSVGSDDALSMLLGDSGKKSKGANKSTKQKKGGDRKRRRQEKESDDDDEDANEPSADESSDDDEGLDDVAKAARKGAKVAEMETYDRMLEHMLKLRREQKGAGKEGRTRALHFRFRALDLLEVAVARLSGEGSSAFASPVVFQLLMPLLQSIRKIASRTRTKQVAGQQAAAADGQALLQRMSALFARAAKAKVPHMVNNGTDATVAAYAAADVTVQSHVDLFTAVCAAAQNAPTAQFVDVCSMAINIILRSLREPSASASGAVSGADVQAQSQPSVTVIPALVAGYSAALESFLTEKHPKVTLPFFRNPLHSSPVLGVHLLAVFARVIAAGGVPKAFKLHEAFTIIQPLIKMCGAASVAELPCEAKKSAAAVVIGSGEKKGKKQQQASSSASTTTVVTVRQALQSASQLLASAIAATLQACIEGKPIAAAVSKDEDAESEERAPLHSKQLREPIECARSMVKAGVIAPGSSAAAVALFSALSAVVSSAAVRNEQAKRSAEQVLDAAGLPVPERPEPVRSTSTGASSSSAAGAASGERPMSKKERKAAARAAAIALKTGQAAGSGGDAMDEDESDDDAEAAAKPQGKQAPKQQQAASKAGSKPQGSTSAAASAPAAGQAKKAVDGKDSSKQQQGPSKAERIAAARAAAIAAVAAAKGGAPAPAAPAATAKPSAAPQAAKPSHNQHQAKKAKHGDKSA